MSTSAVGADPEPLALLRALVDEVGNEPVADNRARRMGAWIQARNYLDRVEARAQGGPSLDVERLRSDIEALEREARRVPATVDGPSANFHTGREYAFREVLAILARLGVAPEPPE